jgi:hypothetical protein
LAPTTAGLGHLGVVDERRLDLDGRHPVPDTFITSSTRPRSQK